MTVTLLNKEKAESFDFGLVNLVEFGEGYIYLEDIAGNPYNLSPETWRLDGIYDHYSPQDEYKKWKIGQNKFSEEETKDPEMPF